MISIDIITSFPRTSRQNDAIMVVINELSTVAHFVEVKSTNSVSVVAQIFIKEIIRLHGVPKKFILDRDAKLTSKFWKGLFID